MQYFCIKEKPKEMARPKPLNYDIYGLYCKQLDAETINFLLITYFQRN